MRRKPEHLDGLCDLFRAVLAHDGHENLRMTHVTADVYGGDSDQTHAWVLDFATDQLRQFALHLIANTLGTAVFFCHACYLLLIRDQTLTV